MCTHEGRFGHMRTRPGHVSAAAPGGLAEAPSTPGLVRRVAFTTDRAMLTRVRCEGNTTSGWHHHGDREVLGHLLRGRLRFEYGSGGRESTEVEEGGDFHVPAGLVHRDVNPGDEAQDILIAFAGAGPPVVNVDGPG
jgi:quercetin dioxygenase-like cupin family protein